MATRSIIAKLDDKGVQAIYCHNDGYLSNNGKILDQHYADEVKVDNLIIQGDASSLRDTIEEIRSQIQEDLITYLDDIDKYNGGHIISEVCKIVSDNFNTLKKQNQNGKEKV